MLVTVSPSPNSLSNQYNYRMLWDKNRLGLDVLSNLESPPMGKNDCEVATVMINSQKVSLLLKGKPVDKLLDDEIDGWPRVTTWPCHT